MNDKSRFATGPEGVEPMGKIVSQETSTEVVPEYTARELELAARIDADKDLADKLRAAVAMWYVDGMGSPSYLDLYEICMDGFKGVKDFDSKTLAAEVLVIVDEDETTVEYLAENGFRQ